MKAIRKLYKSQNGYALPSVLMIASLITLLLFSLLTIISFNGFIASKKINKKKLELACVSAINKLLAEQRRPETADRITTEGSTTIRITVKQYGLFYQAKVTAGNSNDSACAVFYLAEKCRKEFTNGLVISDPNLQAAIAGTTLIDGNILSATDNFTRGQISEFPENGDIFHEGARDISDSLKVKLFFPLVDNRLYEPEDESKPITISGTLNLTNAELSNWASAEQIIIEGDLHINGKVIYPELFGLKILVNGNIIIEDNSEFNVPIEFDCKGNIEIGKNCLISACILLSEKDVKIDESKFNGVQIIAKENIKVDDCLFNYPSFIKLDVVTENKEEIDSKIEIINSVINGYILLTNTTTGMSGNNSIIRIDESSRIQGLVYSENRLELHAPVYGVVYTYNFWNYVKPTEYINWLINTHIMRDSLDFKFLMPIGFYKENDLEILKTVWLY